MKPKKLKLGFFPTKVEKIILDGEEILIKRDDLTELVGSGNKIRKLEYFFYKAKKEKVKKIVTCGAIQSNHARVAAYLARKLNFEPVLFLRGEKSKTYEGNLFLNHLFGAEIHFVKEREYEEIDKIMEEYKNSEMKKKNKVLLIPEGGSDELGLWGYVDAFSEMKEFILKNKIDSIFCAVGSGGTYAGLFLGKKIFNLDTKICGVLVTRNKKYFEEKIEKILKGAIEKYKLNINFSKEEFVFYENYIGEGYGIPYKEEIEIIKKMAKKGIILDPVYTGKAFYGFLNERKNYNKPLFLHTGGIFSIFAFKEYF